MQPTTLMITSLLAGALAGIAPQIPDWIRTVPSPPAGGGSGTPALQPIQTTWPGSPKPPLSLRREDGSWVGYLPLRNPSPKPLVACIEAHAQAARGDDLRVTITPGRVDIGPFAAVIQKIAVSQSGVTPQSDLGTGFLRIFRGDSTESAENTCALKEASAPAELEIRLPERPLAGYIFLFPLIAAAIVAVVTGFNLHGRQIGLFHSMGTANWAFDKSWGANVTIGSSLLVALIGLTTFPSRPRLMTKPSYALLQLLFGALVSLAPLVYNLIRRETVVDVGGFPQVSARGYVVTFLLAGGLVLWAAMGQILTLAVLTREFLLSGVMDATTALTLEGLSASLILLLLVYGFRSLYSSAKSVSTPPTPGILRPGPQLPAPGADIPHALTEWSIL